MGPRGHVVSHVSGLCGVGRVPREEPAAGRHGLAGLPGLLALVDGAQIPEAHPGAVVRHEAAHLS